MQDGLQLAGGQLGGHFDLSLLQSDFVQTFCVAAFFTGFLLSEAKALPDINTRVQIPKMIFFI